MKTISFSHTGNTLGIVVSWVILFFLILLVSPVQAAVSKDRDFDHFSTGFPLSGAHNRVDCEACHIRGVFKGTPKQCGTCHNGRISVGKNAKHIASGDNCDDCHTSFSWDTNAVDHTSVIGICTDCHKLPRKHIETVAACDSCHNTLSWNAVRFDHDGVNGNCVSCHNGIKAVGKTRSHPQTSDICEDCHKNFNSFSGAVFDHAGVTGNCVSCHTPGGSATPKSTNHPPTSNICEDCHKSFNSFAGAIFDHVGVTGSCVSCHNNVIAIGKTAAHPVTSDNCEECHTNFNNFGGADPHVGVTGNCFSCHKPGGPGPYKPATHPVTSDICEDCHKSFNSFAGADHHAGVTGNCVSCHNGAPIIGKPNTHINTNNLCENCHNFSGFSPVARMDHGSVIGSCESCHAADKRAANNHVVTNGACDRCHGSRTSWTANVRVDHTLVSGVCSSCHARPTPHFAGECDVCHRTTSWTARLSYSHSSGDYPGNHKSAVGCLDCHRNFSLTANWTSPAFKPFCAGCHEGNFRRNGSHIGGSNGTVAQNKNCGQSGCHRVSSSGF